MTRRDSRLLMLAGHYARLPGAAALVATVAADVTRQHVTPLLWAAVAAWALFIVALCADFGYHRRRRLCERCIAGVPLDAQAQADRWRTVLRLHHAVVVRSAVQAVALLLGIWGSGGRHPHGWGYAAEAVFLGAFCASLGSDIRHRTLRPWCPYCHWPDGGDAEATPDVPAPVQSR